jgi:phospholipase C
MIGGILLGILACVLPSIGLAASKASRVPVTPIRHLIVIVGEKRTFDNVFGGYRPSRGQTVLNLLSEGIINADGTPGPNFIKTQQWQASDTDKTQSLLIGRNSLNRSRNQNTTYAFGRPPGVPDTRFPQSLPNGPFPISRYTAYQLSFTGDPVHRFFQMWQQFDEGRSDLFPWVGITIGMGGEGRPLPSPLSDQSTRQGGVSMGFYNIGEGDAPVFKFIADNYAIADDFHQGIMGGSGASFIYLGTGDLAFYSDGNGTPTAPPKNLIEDPDPTPGSNNWYVPRWLRQWLVCGLCRPEPTGRRRNHQFSQVDQTTDQMRA